MPKYDRELIARMLSCYDGGGYTNEAVAEQIHLLCEAENLEADARTVVREVPDGMVLVPREPTGEMCEAAMNALGWSRSKDAALSAPVTPDSSMMEGAMKVWRAMIAAAGGEVG